MNTQHRQLPRDVLDQAVKAMKEEPVTVGPKSELVAATLAALETETDFFATTPAVAARNEASAERNTQMFRIIRWGVLAAAVLLLIGGISLRGVWERGGSIVFAQMAENVKKATSVSLECHYRRHGKTV